jgi:hypothetical protein
MSALHGVQVDTFRTQGIPVDLIYDSTHHLERPCAAKNEPEYTATQPITPLQATEATTAAH